MRLVVVGGVAAGLSAASRARRLDSSAEIIVLEKGRRISYGACGLPYWIEGQVGSLDDLTVYTPEFFERERNIRIRTECEAAAIQHPRREVVLRSGERLRYDKLIWAAGARPTARPAAAKVHVLHTDRDAQRLQEFLKSAQPRTAAVVGGGYIGLEMATALRARGLAVTLIHDNLQLLNREDDWLTKKLVGQLERCRVTVRLNTTAGPSDQLPYDLVLQAAGLKPNVEVMADAGAELGRTGALRVDDRQETSLSGVYAAGDCCETMHVVSGKPVWVPLGTTANKTGRVAGSNAAGARERFPGIAGTSIVRVAGMAVAMTGLSVQQARREGFLPVEANIESREKPKYFHGRKTSVQLVADRNSRRLLGGVVLGENTAAGRINVIAAALGARMKADDLAGLDLAYAPPYASVHDPLLLAAQQLLKALD